MIDPRAIIDPSAVIGEGVAIGPWTTIGAAVVVGDGCRIASHVVVDGPTRIGCNNQIFQFSSLGGQSPAALHEGESAVVGELVIGDRNTFREGVTVHRGAERARAQTIFGSHNLLMAGAHVGHDCVLGNHISMANRAVAHDNVTIGDYADIGGSATIVQDRTVGSCAHVGALSLISNDVPDYLAVSGNPSSVTGLNLDGMRRRGEAAEVIAALQAAYQTVYRNGLSVAEALEVVRASARNCREVQLFLESVEASLHDGSMDLVRLRGGDTTEV